VNKRLKASLDGRFHFDPLLVLACSSLLLIGFVMVASASLHLGVKVTGSEFYYPLRQLIHTGLGFVLGFFIAATPLRMWEKWGAWLFIVGLLLLMVLIPGLGIKVNGSIRWLSIAGIRIQVSEVIKFFRSFTWQVM